MFLNRVRAVHFVGVGGIGMSGLAELLLDRGFQVSGSDQRESPTVSRLRARGAVVWIGHAPSNLEGAGLVVRSSAIHSDNPELLEASRRGVWVVHRAELLAELMRGLYGVAVAGTHGKTTTSAMLAACLDGGALDPSVVVGGWVPGLGGRNARWGTGEVFVAEADESDGSFLWLSPTITLITNIDREHLDHYGSFEALEQGFLSMANRVPFYGFAVMCADHEVVRRLQARVARRVVSYGVGPECDYRALDAEYAELSSSFTLCHGREVLGRVRLAVPGHHNVLNATGALATAHQLGVAFSAASEALASFRSVSRRFSVLGEASGVMVVDDYGHHPVEIVATLKAARQGFPQRRLIGVLQPHRFTRLADLWTDFSSCLGEAPIAVLVPVYPAGETPLPGINHQSLGRALVEVGHECVIVTESLEEASQVLAKTVRSGDLVITLGAGDVNRVGQALLQRLQEKLGSSCG